MVRVKPVATLNRDFDRRRVDPENRHVTFHQGESAHYRLARLSIQRQRFAIVPGPKNRGSATPAWLLCSLPQTHNSFTSSSSASRSSHSR